MNLRRTVPHAVRIACIADTHLLAPDTESATLFPKRMRAMPLEEQSAFYRLVSLEVERAYEACMEEVRRMRPDVIVHLGDVTSGWGTKHGMGHPSIRDMAARCADDLRSLGVPVYCSLGNHDLGELEDPARAEEARQAVEAYEQIFGALHWSFVAGDVLSLGICSEIAAYDGADLTLLERRHAQEQFIAKTFAAHPERNWVLYIHNPFAVRHIISLLAPHLGRCRKIVAGHLHRPNATWCFRSLAALQVMQGARRRALLKALRKVVICPSTAPLWYRGYGITRLSCADGRLWRKDIDVARPEESADLPTTSLTWCLRGMSND